MTEMTIETKLAICDACRQIADIMIRLRPPTISDEKYLDLDIVASDFVDALWALNPEMPKMPHKRQP